MQGKLARAAEPLREMGFHLHAVGYRVKDVLTSPSSLAGKSYADA